MAERRKRSSPAAGLVIGQRATPKETARASVSATLSCGDYLSFSRPFPKVGETLWCTKCRTEQSVVKVDPEYMIRCRSCRYSRRCGRAKLTAHTFASKHALSRAHVVVVLLGDRIVHTSGSQDRQLTFEALDPPPF